MNDSIKASPSSDALESQLAATIRSLHHLDLLCGGEGVDVARVLQGPSTSSPTSNILDHFKGMSIKPKVETRGVFFINIEGKPPALNIGEVYQSIGSASGNNAMHGWIAERLDLALGVVRRHLLEVDCEFELATILAESPGEETASLKIKVVLLQLFNLGNGVLGLGYHSGQGGGNASVEEVISRVTSSAIVNATRSGERFKDDLAVLIRTGIQATKVIEHLQSNMGAQSMALMPNSLGTGLPYNDLVHWIGVGNPSPGESVQPDLWESTEGGKTLGEELS